MKKDDFLFEILTEELPPKALCRLGYSFHESVLEGLKEHQLTYDHAKLFLTPRRIAILISDLAYSQKEQIIERKGPTVKAAYDSHGNPTKATIGFAQSLGVHPKDLIKIQNKSGEWLGYRQTVPGKDITTLLPEIITSGLDRLPIPKRMRWGQGDILFVRPIHRMLMIYGEKIINCPILGYTPDNKTEGHRFMAPGLITITHPRVYEKLLEEHFVIAHFEKRKEKIVQLAHRCCEHLSIQSKVIIPEDLLEEVTGLVEWPEALLGSYQEQFLKLPKEVLISEMEAHQRYFAVEDSEQKLLPYFITISNIKSLEPLHVVRGNERVLSARLSDAAFFYEMDQKQSLAERVDLLKSIIFQGGLGTLFEKTQRVMKLASFIAELLNANVDEVKKASLLLKTDLTTQMVNEFPSLQGVMGYYYALVNGEGQSIAQSIYEHYLPRFSGDKLPESIVGSICSLADKMDTLVGAFSINQIPTGDKDPYGLRRACIGIIRLLIENNMNLNLNKLLAFSLQQFPNKDTNVLDQLTKFIEFRLRSWFLEKGFTPDVFSSVSALRLTNLVDMDKRIKAVQSFKKLKEANALSIANKRVSNILEKYNNTIEAQSINPSFFDDAAEKELALALESKNQTLDKLLQNGSYDQVLVQLSELDKPINDFFDHVLVMTEDKMKRENRLLLLQKLRSLFLKVADIALLQ